MNTPEQAGATLARDMIAMVESHFQLNDERMIAMNAMLGAFIYFEENIYGEPSEHNMAIHNGFMKVLYPYINDRINNAVQLDDEAKKRLLEANDLTQSLYSA